MKDQTGEGHHHCVDQPPCHVRPQGRHRGIPSDIKLFDIFSQEVSGVIQVTMAMLDSCTSMSVYTVSLASYTDSPLLFCYAELNRRGEWV